MSVQGLGQFIPFVDEKARVEAVPQTKSVVVRFEEGEFNFVGVKEELLKDTAFTVLVTSPKALAKRIAQAFEYEKEKARLKQKICCFEISFFQVNVRIYRIWKQDQIEGAVQRFLSRESTETRNKQDKLTDCIMRALFLSRLPLVEET